MSPKEKKELVGYLKKETDRLDKAISKAHETGRYGRVAHYEQMRDALVSTLSKIITEKPAPLKQGKNLLFILMMFAFSGCEKNYYDAYFAVDNSTKRQYEVFTFYNHSLHDGRAMNAVWDFADGTTLKSDEKEVRHQFAATGVFEVTLSISDKSAEAKPRKQLQ